MLVTALALAGVAHPALAEPQAQESLPPNLAPDVSDPMLSPPPTAPRQIGSWDEALALIRAQSPDYVSSYESVVRTEAQKRIVLAAVLPILNGQGSYTHQFFTEEITFPTDAGPFGFVSPSPDVLTVGVGGELVHPESARALRSRHRSEEDRGGEAFVLRSAAAHRHVRRAHNARDPGGLARRRAESGRASLGARATRPHAGAAAVRARHGARRRPGAARHRVGEAPHHQRRRGAAAVARDPRRRAWLARRRRLRPATSISSTSRRRSRGRAA